MVGGMEDVWCTKGVTASGVLSSAAREIDYSLKVWHFCVLLHMASQQASSFFQNELGPGGFLPPVLVSRWLFLWSLFHGYFTKHFLTSAVLPSTSCHFSWHLYSSRFLDNLSSVLSSSHFGFCTLGLSSDIRKYIFVSASRDLPHWDPFAFCLLLTAALVIALTALPHAWQLSVFLFHFKCLCLFESTYTHLIIYF